MSADESVYKSKLFTVAVDDSKSSQKAVEFALRICHKPDKVEIAHAMCDTSNKDAVMAKFESMWKAHESVIGLTMLKEESGEKSIKSRICNHVNRAKVDCLVTGCHSQPYERKQKIAEGSDKLSILGSMTESSLRMARCTSIVVPRMLDIPEKREEWIFVIGVDGSMNSKNCFDVVMSMVKPGQTVYVVHVKTPSSDDDSIPEPFRSKTVIQKYTDAITEAEKTVKAIIKMETLINPDVCDTLCEFSEKVNAHMLCCGADGMTAYLDSKRFMGSVSDCCVQNAKCAVLITQLNDFVASDF